MHEPFRTDQRLIEENAFLNQRLRKQAPSERRECRRGKRPGRVIAGRVSLRLANCLRSMNIFVRV
jgi:hypothetical protein